MYAHSVPRKPMTEWEGLAEHLTAVGAEASRFGSVFGLSMAAEIAGRLHDIGKASEEFQNYIASPRQPSRGPNHSSAGALEAIKAYPGPLGRLLASIIAGHHAGLADGADIKRRLDPSNPVPAYTGWQTLVGSLPTMGRLAPTASFKRSALSGFSQAFLTRMLFSCLVDADYLATDAFYRRAAGAEVPTSHALGMGELRGRVRSHMAGLHTESSAVVADLRAKVLEHAVGKASLSPGLFTLTVPTGGGKTLASLSFALEHAVRHGLQRVIYVIPFTSIIEQTAAVFRAALKTHDDVLEHHSSFDWDKAERVAGEDGGSGLQKLRKAAENWDAPIVVTTAVQFFESLYAHRPSRCRRLHNLAGAVIVLDEAQTLPLPVLRPCLAALQELAANYGASIVLCTATQPALRVQDGFEGGLVIGEERELAPDPPALYQALRRVTVETLREPIPDKVIAERFAAQPQMLCIVNSRAHARGLFEAIRHLDGAAHLSTLMCPRHRRAVLATVRNRLQDGLPVRLISTSLIEAGVDIDLPEVWRAAAGLDSIAQAAGRCNRNGRLPLGRVVVFTPAEATPPRALEAFWQAARPVLASHADPLSLPAVKAYFRELYWQRGDDALDATEIDGQRGVLKAIAQHAAEGGFPFRSIGEAFRLIEDAMPPVIVPYDAEAVDLLKAIAAMERPLASQLRRLQQYTCSIPHKARDAWLAMGALQPAHPALGEAMLCFADKEAHYDKTTGLDLASIGLRAAESNVI